MKELSGMHKDTKVPDPFVSFNDIYGKNLGWRFAGSFLFVTFAGWKVE